MKATWNNTVIAESDQTILIEGNHYFPKDAVNMQHLENSGTHTICPWKGEASYYHLVNGDEQVKDAAWYYRTPKEGSIDKVGGDFTDYVAFYPNIVNIS